MLMAGCERPVARDPEVPTDVKIRRLVSDVDDFSQTPRELKSAVPRLFAPGHKPSDEVLPRYADYRYKEKQPVQSGDSATISVVLKDAKSGGPAGEMKWSMTKINGVWKLTDAPWSIMSGGRSPTSFRGFLISTSRLSSRRSFARGL
jgi:hypothetical protein